MMKPAFSISGTIVLCLMLTCCNNSKQNPPDEHSPETSLADLKVADGLEVTLFASEPMFTNPTNMDIDARGRVWICEAFNYRNQHNPKNPVRGEGDRIMILEDTDGDGAADKSKVFYQGTDVNAALGICVLGNKVIVSCSPNVFVFTDADGDDVPDTKEIFFQGIKGIQHDHAIHAFTFGPDGKLYFNMGNEGGVLVDPKGDTVTDVRGNKVVTNGKPYRDGLALRCDMSGSYVEVLGHNFRNNYELTVDPYGTVWQSDNDDDGNKGTRINYVMQYGNFGYKDEMTGASWYARRTNMEKEIPFRHWHLNDPGVVPNLLQTGSGSPTGITLYEGTMLPEKFRGQLIHAEPGHNVVRSYAIENDGAGYKATINNILEGNKDQWFRPADVTVAPDGSLFVADWYDPGVGGHQMGDPNRGRIYRIATRNNKYQIESLDVKSPEKAVAALLNPNPATRYLGWQALATMGLRAEEALLQLWKSGNERHRAQALWLLTKLEGKSQQYLGESLHDKNPDIRITGIRVAEQILPKEDMLTVIQDLVKDENPQVRRELALALNTHTGETPAKLWSALAQQYDGKDRWYLEALGIGAEKNWDLCFQAWRKDVGENFDTPASRDIIWRSRSAAAIPLLASFIKSSDDKEMLRYFRAFDFQSDPSKQKVLADIVVQSKGDKVLYALKHVDPSKLKMTPPVKKALNRVLTEQKGKIEFVELVSMFRLEDRADELLRLGLTFPDSTVGKESVKVLLDWNKTAMIKEVLYSPNKDQAQAMIKALWPHMYSVKAIALMESFMLDISRDIELRKLAVKTFGGPWESEDRLLVLAKEKKLPDDLHLVASGVFQNAWRGTLREEAAKYLTVPGKSGAPLPSIAVLVDKPGNAENGKSVFKNNCANCHIIRKEGTDFGPDLSEIGAKLSKEGLYSAIIFPDQGISFGFEAWRIKLNDGSTAFGRITSETEDKIEIQYLTNKQTVLKADIASRTKLENSLMPSNLPSNMTEQELVDLVEYLSTLQKPSM
jgi:putative membrane-bound dehydrogenase-like protein